MSIEKDVRHASRQTVERALALRDEIKLQAHLFSLDAQRLWSKLDTQVAALEQRALRDGEQALEALKTSAQELTRELNEFMQTDVNASVGLLTRVRSLMSTHVRSCHPDDSLSLAAHLMWNEDCGIVPVVSSDRSVVGVVTDRDVCMATYIQGRGPSELRVESAMSKELFSCAADDSLDSALKLMAEKRVRRLPVLDDERQLIGILSLADVIHWAAGLANPTIDTAVVATVDAISARSPQKVAAAE